MGDEKSSVSRRRALKIIGAGTAGTMALYTNAAYGQHEHMQHGARAHAASAEASQPRFFTPAEMAALVDDSHRLRKKVAVHCHGDQAGREAIEAGVDSIEHGSFL